MYYLTNVQCTIWQSGQSIILIPCSLLLTPKTYPDPTPNGTNAQRVWTISECTMVITVRDILRNKGAIGR